MNIQEALLNHHSKATTTTIVNYIGNNPTRFKQLIKCLCSTDSLLQQRAAWPLSYVLEAHPQLIKPHWDALIKLLSTDSIHNAVYRNITRALQTIAIPEAYEAIVLDRCYHFLLDPKEAIAVRVFSMQIIANACSKYPELKKEFYASLELILPHASNGMKARARLLLKAS